MTYAFIKITISECWICVNGLVIAKDSLKMPIELLEGNAFQIVSLERLFIRSDFLIQPFGSLYKLSFPK
jgi:hypothetical protein